MKKITKHGIKRLKQRNKNQCRNGIANIAKKCGKTKRYFDGEFYEYLLTKSSRDCIVKVYKNDIYIYARTSKKLITTYPVPKKFIPTEQYLLEKEKRYVIENIVKYLNKNVIITLKNGEQIQGIILDKIKNNLLQICEIILKINEQNMLLEVDNIEKIEFDYDIFNKEIMKAMGISA